MTGKKEMGMGEGEVQITVRDVDLTGLAVVVLLFPNVNRDETLKHI